jgi:hypothetical protein
VDAPPRLEIRRVEVPNGRVNGSPVLVPSRGVDFGEAAHGAVPELARVGLGSGGRPGGGEQAVAVGLDLPAVVEAEDHRRRRRLGVARPGRGLPRDAALPDPVEAAALLVLERQDDVPPGGRGGRRGGDPGEEWRRGSGRRGRRQCLGDGGAGGVAEELAHSRVGLGFSRELAFLVRWRAVFFVSALFSVSFCGQARRPMRW